VFGEGKPYADDQADDMMAEADHVAQFDAWVEGFITHVALKGIVATKDDERAAKSTTNV
jgi:hypothetical protein